MRILVTVLAPSAGTVRVCGFDARTQGDQVRGRIGYLPQELTMYSSLTVLSSCATWRSSRASGTGARRPPP